MTEQERKTTRSGGAEQRKNRQARIFLLLLLLLVLVILVLFLRRCSSQEPPVVAPAVAPVVESPVDSVVTDTVADTLAVEEREPEPPVVAPPPKPDTPVPEVDTSVRPDTMPVTDSLSSPSDSTDDTLSAVIPPPEKGCDGDTAALWVYPDPSGGLHYRKVKVVFIANRPASVHYRMQGDTAWVLYDGTPVAITSTTTLFYDAIDSCGNVMERRSEYYEIESARSSSDCPKGMEQVRVGEMNFCIDRYEWPNRRGELPRSYISLYQATDSCFSVGKRLCTAEEWAIACAGPYSWNYPYGQKYEPYACGTQDTVVAPSGSRPECRGYFGIFDMSGNLLEWTSTKSAENSSFYYVAGGFWESGSKSGCHDKRYSYYPQNRHNPVGFRCCSDAASEKSTDGGGNH